MNIGQRIVQQWHDHGTKYLATAATVCGAIQASAVFSSKQQAWLGLASTLLGLATFKRGFTNSANAPPP